MTQPDRCLICDKPLTTGKGGNCRRCMVCDQFICSTCAHHGICNTHFDPSNKTIEYEFQQNFRNYWIIIFISIIVTLLLMWVFVYLAELFEDLVLLFLIFELMMIPLIIAMLVIIRKNFVKKAKKIFNNYSGHV